jgi:phage repressor protein C with HTH and peptisase S24 domain
MAKSNVRALRKHMGMNDKEFGEAHSADNGDGSVTIGPALEHAQRPRNLIGREGAYGLFISNDDMAPVFRYGDIVWVDPILPPARDSEVVVEGRDRTAAIGTLTMLNREAVTVEVLKPERRKIEMEREADTKVHRIVGKEARR